MNSSAFLIFGNQLFPQELLSPYKKSHFFLAEDQELCTHFRYHKHKLILFLASMREYAEDIKKKGYALEYQTIEQSEGLSFEQKLLRFLKKHKYKNLFCFEIEDKFMEERIFALCKEQGISLHTIASPMFLCARSEFRDYLKSVKKPFQKTFYERERKRLKILVNKEGKPVGDRWSFDEENRKALPKNVKPPRLPFPAQRKITKALVKIVEEKFPNHPGEAENFWLPTTRAEALTWLEDFLKNRLYNFGPYEDAIEPQEDFLFHSVLSPVMNLGLLTPQEIIEKALDHHKKEKVPLQSLEGFLRQVMGWREFVRGIYQNFSEKEERSNFFQHTAKLSKHWYRGDFGIPPLDEAIRKATALGYNHHIERLMILSNTMLLSEIHPKEVHRWFMEMYVDSSDWVMGPNVYGMGQFSDGGLFATKPYICGSNYWRKMSSYKKGPWCDTIDGLYWRFIDKHRSFFLKNPRLAMMVRSYDKMDLDRKKLLLAKAESFLSIAQA